MISLLIFYPSQITTLKKKWDFFINKWHFLLQIRPCIVIIQSIIQKINWKGQNYSFKQSLPLNPITIWHFEKWSKKKIFCWLPSFFSPEQGHSCSCCQYVTQQHNQVALLSYLEQADCTMDTQELEHLSGLLIYIDAWNNSYDQNKTLPGMHHIWRVENQISYRY